MPATHAAPAPSPLHRGLDDATTRRRRCLAELDDLDRDLRAMRSAAFVKGDFDEITRLEAASQAVHVAAISLRGDGRHDR